MSITVNQDDTVTITLTSAQFDSLKRVLQYTEQNEINFYQEELQANGVENAADYVYHHARSVGEAVGLGNMFDADADLLEG